ncbi:U3 snoRNP protein [Emydomyces testavorans]|uniref:U3 snoRNP protein n=1 Tax=Emydomyces testavorans TaxID=2070801 RepID=A0AAF0DG02_9EURO|nr:U3 snoRNP protein [Emydomyces testavorans]
MRPTRVLSAVKSAGTVVPVDQKYTLQSYGIWERLRRLLSVDPNRSTGVPINAQFRNPTPGALPPQSYTDPVTIPAGDIADNPYWKRDVRRNYPQPSVLSQADVVGLLMVGSKAEPNEPALLPGDAGKQQLVEIKQEGEERGLAAFYAEKERGVARVLGPNGLPPFPANLNRAAKYPKSEEQSYPSIIKYGLAVKSRGLGLKMESPSSAQRPAFDATAVTPLTESLSSNPEAFLGPSALLFNQSAAALKHYLDSLASSTTQLQQRQQLLQSRQKRKRTDNTFSSKKLQLREVHTNGFNVRQIWEQAHRVLKTSSEVTRQHFAVRSESLGSQSEHVSSGNGLVSKPEDGAQFGQDDGSGPNITGESEGDEDSEDKSGFPDEAKDDDGRDEKPKKVKFRFSNETDALKNGDVASSQKRTGTFTRDRHGLNDGFFSIDEFNKQSMLFEELDAKRAINDNVGSEEEEIDWEADPFLAGEAESDLDEEQEGQDELADGSLEDEDAELLDEDMAGVSDLGDDDAHNATYDQFFDPPASAQLKKESLSKGQSQGPESDFDLDADIERAMADVHRDLFEDEDSASDDDGTSHQRDKTTDTNPSTHEKARAKITDEIRRLEAANVANKEWTLIGEAKAADRPINSLIEEDLDFERVGKPVPVITVEITDDIESLIKRRVVAKEFDDIIRRPPPGLSDYTETKSKFVLDEKKPQQSLAELYEVDHLKATDRNYVSKKDEKLQKERDEITGLWNDICSQLDTLSNLHFRPKQPSANIRVVAGVDTIVMEDIRPSGGDGLSTAGTLAPQEVYAPGDKSRNGEVMMKSGAAVARDEMSREEKLRHRRREKQKKRKRAMKALASQDTPAAKKQELVSSLGKGGVKIIGKDGALRDVRGQKVSASDRPTAQQALKL